MSDKDKNENKKIKKKHTPWDDAFKQLLCATLPDLGLKVVEDVTLGELPLEADLVIISQPEQPELKEWQQHPLWQHCTDLNLVEFKSVGDPLLKGDFEVLLAYTLLYRFKYEVSYTTELSSWLILPAVNKVLKAALKHYKIELTEILPGFWQGQTLFPLYVVAYNDLPFEMPYNLLKLFIKSGQPVQKVFADMLKSEQREKWLAAIQKAMALIHPRDFKEVLSKMGLATERKELRATIRELLKDDIDKEIETEKLASISRIAKQMLADGQPIDLISKYTGLSPEYIKSLI